MSVNWIRNHQLKFSKQRHEKSNFKHSKSWNLNKIKRKVKKIIKAEVRNTYPKVSHENPLQNSPKKAWKCKKKMGENGDYMI